MPSITLITDSTTREIPFSSGSTARELLDAAGIRIRLGCRGNGACGLCLVQIVEGFANLPTKNERLILSSEQIEQNIRLACQLIPDPDKDLCIRVINHVSQSSWRNLNPCQLPCTPSHLNPSTGEQLLKTTYGLAVDLGTTHISLSLSVSIIAHPRHAGTLHPKPSIIGMKPFPWSPIRCISESMRNATLARYPESSSRLRTRKNGTI